MLESDNPILPAFLVTDDYVPGAFRDLLTEADGCLQKGFLTGGTACARRALDLLLTVAKTEGATYEERLQSLGDKHGIAKMLTSILVQCGGASARDNATLSVEADIRSDGPAGDPGSDREPFDANKAFRNGKLSAGRSTKSSRRALAIVRRLVFIVILLCYSQNPPRSTINFNASSS
jgi:hypothetical protein